MRPIAFLLCLLLAVSACGEAATPDDVESTSVVSFDDGKADSLDPLRVRAAGMTIWADTAIRPDIAGFVMSARSSHDIARLRATIGDVEVNARQVSSRKFEVYLEGAVADVVAGTPLLVEITTTAGRVRTVSFTGRARFGAAQGSSKLYFWKNLAPVIVAGETMFRGRLTTRGEFVELHGTNDDDSEPIVTQEDATHWIADFPAYALPWAAHPTEDRVTFTATDADGNRHSRNVEILLQVDEVGVTSDDPAQAWPAPVCEDDVRACVESRGADADLEACGAAIDVRPCLGEVPVDDTSLLRDRFKTGLLAALLERYDAQGADIVASGGNTSSQALSSVDTAKMTEVTDPEEDPSGRDHALYRVFSHPDVVFPGSDIVWYGVFDRADGTLVEVFDFN